jgi:hypothetical protein
MLKALAFAAVGLLVIGTMLPAAAARRKTDNKLSPSASTSITLGGHSITIEYNAPSARDRKVEGGLIPYGRVWRTGADAATTLTTDADLMIGDLRVPKGEHTIFTLASPAGWKLVINKQTGQWGLQYDQAQDLGSVPLTLTTLSAPVETFRITLKGTGPASGTLTLTWGGTAATVTVKLAQ